MNNNCLQYNKTSLNDLNRKITTTEVNGYVGPVLRQAEHSGGLSLLIGFHTPSLDI